MRQLASWSCLLLFLPTLVWADTYTVERAVVSATGGTVTGGQIQLNFTVGQGAAGYHTGLNSQLTSGYWWQVQGVVVAADPSPPTPSQFSLSPATPNPFRMQTVISYGVPREGTGRVSIEVFDVRGHRVKALVDSRQSAGWYRTIWDGSGEGGQALASGVYFIRFQAPNFVRHRRVVMLR